MAEHLAYLQVEGTYTVALLEGKVSVTCCLAHNIHGCPFAVSYLAYMLEVLLVDQESHSLLALVGNDFLGRESLVADG